MVLSFNKELLMDDFDNNYSNFKLDFHYKINIIKRV